MTYSVAEQLRGWEDRISSIIADPTSPLKPDDFTDPNRLLQVTANLFGVRRPRCDGAVGQAVLLIADDFAEMMKRKER